MIPWDHHNCSARWLSMEEYYKNWCYSSIQESNTTNRKRTDNMDRAAAITRDTSTTYTKSRSWQTGDPIGWETEEWDKIPRQGGQNIGMNCCQLKKKGGLPPTGLPPGVLPTGRDCCQLGGIVTNWDGLPPGVQPTCGDCHQMELTVINCCQLGKNGGCHQLQGRDGVLSWQD